MTATVEAIYEEGGILRLLAPIPLQAGERVRVVLDNEPSPAASPESVPSGNFDPQRALAAVMAIAALSVEPKDGPETGSIDHDKILYGEHGAR